MPGSALKLTIGRAKSVALVHSIWNGRGKFQKQNVLIAVFSQKAFPEKSAEPTPNAASRIDDNVAADKMNVYPIGTVGRIVGLTRMGEDRYNMLIQGLCRFRYTRTVQDSPYYRIEGVVAADVGSNDDATVRATALKVRLATKELLEIQAGVGKKGEPTKLSSPSTTFLNTINHLSAGELADAIAGAMEGDVSEKYAILASLDLKSRLGQALTLVSKQLETLKISKKIQSSVEGNLKSTQREYILRQQLKAIQKELGDGGDEEEVDEINELKARLEALPLPPDARKTVTRECKRLARMQPVQPEYSVILTYLEWMADLPWGKYSDDSVDVLKVKAQLDADHYGLEKVKRRLVEFLAIKQLHHLKAQMRLSKGADKDVTEAVEEVKTGEDGLVEKDRVAGAIMCLLGPPGVGKTSLGNSVARALGRSFHRMALGGVRDEAELRGHRRTYIGAMPGNIITGLKKAGTQNPVILLDEVDKLGRDARGDPASALLEILDPEQNSHFVDHYLNTPFDLSDVLFFATANDLATVPGPLRDRMEIIQIPGYTTMEKVKIASAHLLPRALKRHALEKEHVVLSPNALIYLIRNYTREAGVRGLERDLSMLCRSIAVRYAEWLSLDVKEFPFKPPVVDEAFIEEVMGPARYSSEAALRVTVPGVATGLAWTSVGGELLFVECTRFRGNGHLQLTGHLGDVMKESAQTALSWIRANVVELGLQEQASMEDQIPLLKHSDVHIHFPAGGIPKDGPSAGVAITSALASLFLGRKVRADTAMTGEVTLRGKVLPVGGIKEKSLAAHREGIRRLCLPSKNRKDAREIPQEIRDDLEIIYVDRLQDALDVVLEGGLDFGTDLSKHMLPLGPRNAQIPAGSNFAALASDPLLSRI